MLAKALIDFGGQYAMHEGDVGELPDNTVTNNLIEEGYVVVVNKADAEKAESEVKEDNSDDEHRKDEPKSAHTKGRPKKQ